MKVETPLVFSRHMPPEWNVVRTEADSSALTRYLQLGERLTSTVNRDYKSTRVKYSGLLNPFQLSFGSNGITYKQEARISKTFEHDRQLRFHPEIGFLFKEKELRLRLITDWEYRPERQGILNLTIANDNQSYSSEVIHQINEILKITGWTATGKSTCIPITRPSGSSWHEAYRTCSAVREIIGGWRPA